MEQEYLILETYIKNVCKGIKDKEARNEIKDELLSHMLEIYDINIALGLNREEAQKDVVSHMGDSGAISKTFTQLYFVNTIVLVLKYVARIFNYVNLSALLMFIPANYGLLLFSTENGTLTDNICVNQTIVTILTAIIIGFISELTEIPRPETGLAIITESEKHIKILVSLFLIPCVCSFFIFDLELQYILVCFMHTMSIFNSSRIINKL